MKKKRDTTDFEILYHTTSNTDDSIKKKDSYYTCS